MWWCAENVLGHQNDSRQRAAANRPVLLERRGRRLRVHVVVMTHFDLMFDVEKKAVACVLLQAAFGCDNSLVQRFGFDTSTWLVAVTPGMKMIRGTEEDWRKAAMIANKQWAGKRAS